MKGIYHNSINIRCLSLFLISFISTTLDWMKSPVFEGKELIIHPPKIIRTCCSFETELKVSAVPVIKGTGSC